jgi:hypothetical protein
LIAFLACLGAATDALARVARGNDLHAFVDGRLVAMAIDDALPRGKYGMGTNRAAATWRDFDVNQ